MNNYDSRVLRASKIGHPCNLNIWFSINGAEEIISEQSSRILELGTILEPVIINWLRTDGWTVKRNPIDSSSNQGISLSIEVAGGKISAHPDCVISGKDTGLIIADIKTMNDMSFRRFKREGTIKAFPNYADQLTIYAKALSNIGLSISELAVIAMNKNNCECHIDYFNFEPARFEVLRERAEFIFSCNEAPEQGDRFQNWCCDYCGYSHLCEHSKRDTTVGDIDIPSTDNQNISNAIELLKEARELAKVGKELEDEAKTVLDKEVRQQNIKSVRTGNIILVLNEITTSRFDSTAFKKLYPDMVKDFMKISTSVRYEIKNLQEAA